MLNPDQARDFSTLTVIIPTYNERHHLVLRTVRHWHNTRVRFIIVDESKSGMPVELQRLLPPTAAYHHVPALFLLERLQYAANLVETEFVLISPDDSFHVHRAVSQCMTRLETDSEILACNGAYLYFARFRNAVTCLPEISDVRVCNSRTDSIRERLVASCNTVFFYGVVRSNAMRACVRMFAPKYSAPCVGLHVFQFGLAFMGKWGSIRELMWFRSYEGEDRFASSRGVDRRVAFHAWYTELPYATEVEETLDRMQHVLVDETHAAVSDIRHELHEVCHYNAGLSSAAEAQAQTKPKAWRRVVGAVLPPPAKTLARRIKHRLVPEGITLAEHLRWLRDHDVCVDDPSVADIECKILSFTAPE